MNSLGILQGHVYHARSETAANSFRYPIFNIYFSVDDTEKLQELFNKRFFKLFSFWPCDYLDNSKGNLRDLVDSFVERNFQFSRGKSYDRVHLQTIPRMFGYVFNPVSFWYFFKDENLAAVMCEVSNTFGEKHYYWLNDPSVNLNKQWLTAEKEFHVSPFFPVNGQYKFRFEISAQEVAAHINFVTSDQTKRLVTWIKGDLSDLSTASPAKLILRYGWMTPLVVVRIHLQAAKLFLKKVRFFTKPELPENTITHGNTHGDKT